MKSSNTITRAGFNLLELTVTMTMLAIISTASMSLVRTSYTAWNRHDDDLSQRREALALQRHLSRHIRQATSVMEMSNSSDVSGNISLLMSTGDIYVWDHNATTKQVLFGVGSATSVLAQGIEELSFTGFGADGTSEVTDVGLIHAITPTLEYNLERPAGTVSYTTSCQSWIRSW